MGTRSLFGGLDYLQAVWKIHILSSSLNCLCLDSLSVSLDVLPGDPDCHINVCTFCPVTYTFCLCVFGDFLLNYLS